MTLDRDDIQAIAAEVVRLMRQTEEMTLDAEYLASLPVAERKAIQQAKMRRWKEEQKAQKH